MKVGCRLVQQALLHEDTLLDRRDNGSLQVSLYLLGTVYFVIAIGNGVAHHSCTNMVIFRELLFGFHRDHHRVFQLYTTSL